MKLREKMLMVKKVRVKIIVSYKFLLWCNGNVVIVMFVS